MPAFTYIASLIVAEVIGIAGAAILGSAGVAFVTSVIAVGLAITTSRLLGLGGGGGGTAQDPGVRIQLPPATQNKIPIVYGSVNTKGVVTDARISNANKTMTYVLALSEQTQSGTVTVGAAYWNDQLLQFRTAAGSEHIVSGSIDQNGTGSANTNFDGLIRVRIYSDGTNSSQQIFPPQSTGNTANARTLLDEADTNYQLHGIIYAVVQIDYDSAKGVTGLGQLTFQLNNTLKNPGEVWYDYMTSTRYGAGIPVTQIDTSTCITNTTTSLLGWSNTIPPNQYLTGGTTASTQVRYEINGVISAGATVKANLDMINAASNSYTSFDYNQGRWRVILNRPATAGELTSAFEFNDNNIIGEVGITATNLEDLYNILEVEYASRVIRDQNDYFRGAIAASEMNDLEPPNSLNMRIDLVNNALHAARVGLIELKGSRVDLIISFRADYSALQCQAGDVVKVTNDVYGFEQKLFRISKMREVEDEVGGITCEITALEYSSTVYTDETLQDSANVAGSGIPTFGGSASLPAPSAPTAATISTTTPSFTLSTTINAASNAVDEVQWFYSTNSTTNFTYLSNIYPVTGTYNPNDTVTGVVTLGQAGTFYFKARTGLASRYSNLSGSSSPGFAWNPNDYGKI
jgi:hypothetical protein